MLEKNLCFSLPGFTLDLSSLNLRGFNLAKEASQIEFFAQALAKKFTEGSVGFFDHPAQTTPEELLKMEALSNEFHEKTETSIIFGIGGSYLGAFSLNQALSPTSKATSYPLVWLSNVDRDEIERVDRLLRGKKKVGAVVVSKSGNTLETLAGFFHFYSRLTKILVITDPTNGELRKQSERHGWYTLSVPPNVGGRYSVLTPVGLFPAALAGIKYREILEGALQMRKALKSLPASENPAHWYALLKHDWDVLHKRNIHYLMPYRTSFRALAEWYVQLWAESLGKFKQHTKTPVGPTPIAALGTLDQHSVLQLIKEGPRDKLLGFIDCRSSTEGLSISPPGFETEFDYLFSHTFEKLSSSALKATERSLGKSGIPTYRIEFDNISPTTLGGFLLFQEYACAFAGELYGVDAFVQPGVEEGKELLRESL